MFPGDALTGLLMVLIILFCEIFPRVYYFVEDLVWRLRKGKKK